MIPAARRTLLALFLVAAGGAVASVQGQLSGPPAGGPTGQFLGPPSGNAGDFLGSWALSWDGPLDWHCPCRGTLVVDVDNAGDLRGTWRGRGPQAILSGSVGYDQNVWTGRFEQRDDSVDFPIRGFFRLEARDKGQALTGSYHPTGATISFRWSGTRN